MTGHESFKNSKSQTDKFVVELTSSNGEHKRKVGMCAVLTSGPNLYKPTAFGGAKIEDPWETLKSYKEKFEKG